MAKRRIRWRLIGVSSLVVLFVVIVLQNTQVVGIQILFWRFSMSRIILLVFSLGVGLAAGLYLRRPRRSEPRSVIVRKQDG